MVQALEGDAEEELLVAHRQAEGVRAGHALDDLPGHPEVMGDLVDLVLVQVGQRLDVRAAVAVPAEVAQEVFRAVGGAPHHQAPAVGLGVEVQHARADLDVGEGSDGAEGLHAQALLSDRPVGQLDLQHVDAERLALQQVGGQGDVVGAAREVLGDQGLEVGVPGRIGPDAVHRGGDVAHVVLDAHGLGVPDGEFRAHRVRLPLGQDQAHHLFGPEGEDGKGGHDRRVYAAAQAHDHAASPERRGFVHDEPGQAIDLALRVDAKDIQTVCHESTSSFQGILSVRF